MTSTFHPQASVETGTMLPRLWLIGVPIAAITLLAAAWVWRGQEQVPPAPPPAPQSWQIQFLNALPESQTAGFSGTYRPGELLFAPPEALFTATAQPSQTIGSWKAVESSWNASGGRLDEKGCLLSPQRPGLYRLRWVSGTEGTHGPLLNVLVLHRSQQQQTGGRTEVSVLAQNIGSFGDPKDSKIEKIAQHATRYQPPDYFALLDSQTLSLPVGRNLELGQLVAFMDRRGADGHKIYTQTRHTNVLPPSKALCDKLSMLMERLQSQGVKVTRFWITSGFRTPIYNRSIGGATHSRHCYGDAVDLVIDEDNDKHMDDLNGDGRLDRLDGLVIAKACQALEREGLVSTGGLGVYEWDADDSVRSHVHIDCRGYPARWGQIAHGRKKLNYDWWSDLEGKDVGDGD